MVLNKADETPLSASLCVNSTTCMSPVTGSGIQLGLQNLLLSGSQSDFLTIIQAIETALQGDASIFATYAFNPIPSVTAVWTMPLLCSDYGMLFVFSRTTLRLTICQILKITHLRLSGIPMMLGRR